MFVGVFFFEGGGGLFWVCLLFGGLLISDVGVLCEIELLFLWLVCLGRLERGRFLSCLLK